MSPRPAHSTSELALDGRLIAGADLSIPLTVRWRYSTADPFALSLEVITGVGLDARWIFARDLLRDGLRAPTGLGDVRIWPPCPCHGRPDLRVLLRGRDGSALVDMPVKPIRTWLRKECFARVPHGSEAEHIDWELELVHVTS
ncbi:SsgA family sporulation/cell division regulator [Streptomyces sp. RerS4]|uniref:SsgA family sporulation/cell division regulator n=1 Tax=Streptomyces sp. RerS4 TaxID=2942449 RepID=UPI00201C66B0|nr:SsgA family sporulation/cell division regulator [Streptomyces sp. RerS4]UQW99355.1 SsgA family sporulation/cell division regulator [Streptomyces sp. RerS4]